MTAIQIDKTHSYAISIVRVIAMISIVVCHFCQAYNNDWAWVLNVGVQVFFALSGYLHSHKDILDWRKWFVGRFIRIFVPLYIYSTIALTVIKFLSEEPVGFLNYLKAGGVFGLNHLWFMKAIALCYLITPVLQLSKKYSLYCLLLLLLLGLVEYLYLRISLFSFSWLWVYSLGYFYPLLSGKVKYALLGLLLVVSLLLTCRMSWYEFVQYEGAMNRAWHDICGLFLCFGGIFILRHFKINKLSLSLTLLDKNSFYIYITHHIYLIGPLALTSVFTNIYGNLMLIVLAIVLSTIMLAFVSNKSINKLFELVG